MEVYTSLGCGSRLVEDCVNAKWNVPLLRKVRMSPLCTGTAVQCLPFPHLRVRHRIAAWRRQGRRLCAGGKPWRLAATPHNAAGGNGGQFGVEPRKIPTLHKGTFSLCDDRLVEDLKLGNRGLKDSRRRQRAFARYQRGATDGIGESRKDFFHAPLEGNAVAGIQRGLRALAPLGDSGF